MNGKYSLVVLAWATLVAANAPAQEAVTAVTPSPSIRQGKTENRDGSDEGTVVRGAPATASQTAGPGSGKLFTYQGLIETASGPVHNQSMVFQAQAWTALTGGSPLAAPQTINLAATEVNNGVFAVKLDAEALAIPANAADTYLEFKACSPGPCTPVTLSPREFLTWAPKSLTTDSVLDVARPAQAGDGSLIVSSSAPQSGALILQSLGNTETMDFRPAEQKFAMFNSSGAATLKVQAVSSTGDLTYMLLDDGASKVTLGTEPAVSNTAGPVTPPPKLAFDFSGDTVALAASAGVNPASLDLKYGTQTAMRIGQDPVSANAVMMVGPEGILLAKNPLAITANVAAGTHFFRLYPGVPSPENAASTEPVAAAGSVLQVQNVFNGVPTTLMAIDGDTGEASFYGTKVRTNRVQIGPVEPATATAAAAGSLFATLEYVPPPMDNSTAAELQLKVNDGTQDYIIARWMGRAGLPPDQQFVNAPNYVAGSPTNYITPGVYGATIVGGGGGGLGNHAVYCPTGIDPPCWDGANRVLQDWGAIVAGSGNVVSQYGFIGGGFDNEAYEAGAVCGGVWNRADGMGFVGGGKLNRAEDGTISGGENNTIAVIYGAGAGNPFIGGGDHNTASAIRSVIVGGEANTTIGPGSAIGGGTNNMASGAASTVPGGQANSAGGFNSFAAGFYAKVRNAAEVGDGDGDQGTFVWNDAADQNPSARYNRIQSTGPNQFIVKASGGLWFGEKLLDTPDAYAPGTENAVIPSGRFIQTTAGAQSCADTCNSTYSYATQLAQLTACIDGCNSDGAYLSTGGTWTNASARESKENFEPVAPQEVLDRVLGLNISRWNYKVEKDSTKHIGPMAQDFHAAFGLGDSEKTISTIDADGVALAAIQGLHELVKEKDCEMNELRSEISDLKALVKSLAENQHRDSHGADRQNGGGR